jgi:hypothetical protein
LTGLILWHGTTRSAAERIAEQGFEATNTAAIVRDAARAHGMPAAPVLAALKMAGRFVVVQEGRDASVWFAATSQDAVTWAQRAPEARWEALWAVWQIHHGGFDVDPAPWVDPRAAAWHLWQFRKDPPAVLQVRVPADRVQDRYQKLVGPETAAERVKIGAREFSVSHPIPAGWVVGYEVLPRDVDLTAAAGMLGLEAEELDDRVRAGLFPAYRPPRRLLHQPYWELEEFLQFLDSDQRRELKMRIGKGGGHPETPNTKVTA